MAFQFDNKIFSNLKLNPSTILALYSSNGKLLTEYSYQQLNFQDVRNYINIYNKNLDTLKH